MFSNRNGFILTDNTESVKNENEMKMKKIYSKMYGRNKLIEHIGCWVE